MGVSALAWLGKDCTICPENLQDSRLLEDVAAFVVTVGLLEGLEGQGTFQVGRSTSNDDILVGTLVAIRVSSSTRIGFTTLIVFGEPGPWVGYRYLVAITRYVDCFLEPPVVIGVVSRFSLALCSGHCLDGTIP